MIAKKNLIKKFIGFNIMESSIFLFFIIIGDKEGAISPILLRNHEVSTLEYANPLPSVIIITAIVITVGTTAIAMALIIKIYEEFGTLNTDDIRGLW